MAGMTAPDPLERRVPVARFSCYRDAKRAVDRLCVARIPGQRITVLGRGITWNPPLTGERSAVLGARIGSVAGALTLLLLSGHVDVRRYDVLVDPDDLPKARKLLER
jgi:hypothetical protein